MNIFLHQPSLLFLILTSFLSSCGDKSFQSRLQKLESDMAEARSLQASALKTLSDETQKNSQRISDLSRITIFPTRHVVINPRENSFTTIDSNIGKLLITCEGAERYLDGYKIALRIGNPYQMTYSGFSLAIEYGSKPTISEDVDFVKMKSQIDAWEHSLKKKSVSFTKDLPPGSWTRVEAIIAPAKPEDIAFMRATLDADTVSLLKAAK